MNPDVVGAIDPAAAAAGIMGAAGSKIGDAHRGGKRRARALHKRLEFHVGISRGTELRINIRLDPV